MSLALFLAFLIIVVLVIYIIVLKYDARLDQIRYDSKNVPTVDEILDRKSDVPTVGEILDDKSTLPSVPSVDSILTGDSSEDIEIKTGNIFEDADLSLAEDRLSTRLVSDSAGIGSGILPYETFVDVELYRFTQELMKYNQDIIETADLVSRGIDDTNTANAENYELLKKYSKDINVIKLAGLGQERMVKSRMIIYNIRENFMYMDPELRTLALAWLLSKCKYEERKHEHEHDEGTITKLFNEAKDAVIDDSVYVLDNVLGLESKIECKYTTLKKLVEENNGEMKERLKLMHANEAPIKGNLIKWMQTPITKQMITYDDGTKNGISTTRYQFAIEEFNKITSKLGKNGMPAMMCTATIASALVAAGMGKDEAIETTRISSFALIDERKEEPAGIIEVVDE